MITTFERLAKILKGLTAPANWIESAFAGIASSSDIPQPSTTIPENLGAASVGTSLKYARADHVHQMPQDFLLAYPSDKAIGETATFYDGAYAPAKNVKVNIMPKQSGIGDPSPENVRAISGFTGVNVIVSPTNDAQDGSTYNVVLPTAAGTVYGGTLDVTNGTLSVEWGIIGPEQLSDESMDWAMNNNGTNIYECYTEKILKANGLSNIISNCLKNISSYSDVADYTIRGYAANNKVAIGVPKSVVGSEKPILVFRQWLYDNNVSVCYELATPTSYTLTPQEIQILLGTNNVWSDAGTVEVEYFADTGLYISELTGPAESDMIADSSITSGKYFLIGNQLYLATANIAAGATLIPGTNCTATNLVEALNAINA